MRMPNASGIIWLMPYAGRMPGETPTALSLSVFALISRTDRIYRGEP